MEVGRGCSGWQGWVEVYRGGRDGWRYIGVAEVGGGG